MSSKEPESDDPLELTGVVLAVPDETSLKEMATCFVEEFLRDGWSDEQLHAMFRNPFYRGPYLVWRQQGDAYIEEVIREVRRHPTPWQGSTRGGAVAPPTENLSSSCDPAVGGAARGWDHA